MTAAGSPNYVDEMDDSVTRFCAASRAADVDAMLATLAPDAELVSPLVANGVFRGQDDLRVLLSAIYGLLTDLEWDEPVGAGPIRLIMGTAKIGKLNLTDAMVLELGESGLIARIRPHLRPWLATTYLALRLGPKMARHPGVLRRSGVV